MVFVALVTREGSDEPVHLRSLARAFADYTYKSLETDDGSDKQEGPRVLGRSPEIAVHKVREKHLYLLILNLFVNFDEIDVSL